MFYREFEFVSWTLLKFFEIFKLLSSSYNCQIDLVPVFPTVHWEQLAEICQQG